MFYECFVWMYVYVAQVPGGCQRGVMIPWNWNLDGSEPSCGCWELNPGSLQDQKVLFNS